MRNLLLIAIGAVSMVACKHEEAAGNRIPIEVKERSGVPRNEVVTSGVPFPKGMLESEASCRILDANDAALECDKTVLARWPDGSVKWLLLDFPLRMESGETRKLMLETGKFSANKTDASPLLVTSTEDHFVVDTGALHVVINRRDFTFFDEVRISSSAGNSLVRGGDSTIQFETDSPGEPQAENWLLDAAGGTRDTSRARISQSEIEFQNTQRIVIRVGGVYASDTGKKTGPFWTRYTFWKNSAQVGVEHFFAIDLDVKKHFLRTVRLRLQIPTQSPLRVTYGVKDRLYTVPEQYLESSLVEVMPDRFRHNIPWDAPRDVRFEVVGKNASGDDAMLTSGHEASGIVSVGGQNGNVAMAMRDFSRLHPKEIYVDAREGILDCYLWPERGGKVLDLRRRYDEIRTEGQYDRGNNAEGGRGVGKTHQLLFGFSSQTPEDAQLTALAERADEPLRAFTSPEQYSASGVFGPFHPVDDAHFPKWEAMLRLQLEYVIRLPHQFRWDGMIDWGDTLLHDYEAVPHRQQEEIPKKGFVVRGYDGWLNNDTNIGREMLLFFLRSEDIRLWQYWERMVMHVMDVDTVHGSRSPQRIGAGRRHDQQHWGSTLSGYGTAAVESSDYYYLTGSQWGREMALKYADWYLQDGGTEWPTKLAAIVRAYELTGDEKYRQFLESPASKEDPQMLKLGSGKISALDNPSWRTAGTETGVDLLWQLTGEEQWKQHFATASDNMLPLANDSKTIKYYALRTFATAYLNSGEQRFLDGLLQLLKEPIYRPADAEYFLKYPDLNEDVTALDFEMLATRSRQIRKPGPSVRTIIYTYRALPSVMAALRKAGLDEKDLFSQ